MKKVLFAILLLFLFIPSIGFSAAPVILFSDMTDAPNTGWEGSATKGAAVSIWCRNIGTSGSITVYNSSGGGSGATTVTLASGTADVPEWAATGYSAKPAVPLGMQRVTFYLNSGMGHLGTYPNSTITVTIDGVVSNTVKFHVRELGTNKIYFFDNAGIDSNTGLNSTTQCKKTPGWMVFNANAGDIAYFRSGGGTYATPNGGGSYPDAAHQRFSSIGFHNGSEGLSISCVGYPGEEPFWDASSLGGAYQYLQQNIWFYAEQVAYWTWAKIKMKATISCVNMGGGSTSGYSNIRLVGNDFSTYNSDATLYAGWGVAVNQSAGAYGLNYWYIIGNYFHDISMTTTRMEHTNHRVYFIYFNGYGATDYAYIGYNEFGWAGGNTESFDGTGCRGVQIYGHQAGDSVSNTYVFNNWSHDVWRTGFTLGGGMGGAIDVVRSLWFLNNLVAAPLRSDDFPIQVPGGYTEGIPSRSYIYNNTLYTPYPKTSPALVSGGVVNLSGPTNVGILKNNIYYAGEYHPYYNYYPTLDGCPNCTASNNLYYGGHTIPTWDGSTLTNNNPLLDGTDRTIYSGFHLTATSPAVGGGTPLSPVSATQSAGLNFPGTQYDFYYVARGSSYDIGAFEYGATVIPPSAQGCTISGGTFQ